MQADTSTGRHIKLPTNALFWKKVQTLAGMINYGQILSKYGVKATNKESRKLDEVKLR